MKMQTSRSDRRGFTLMEVLLVLAILVVLASLSTVFITRMQRQAYVSAAKAEISNLESLMQAYHINVLSYPDTNQGLAALRQAPADLKDPSRWQGPYLQKDVPMDPWGNAYQYQLTSPETFVISSAGPDSTPGTDDDISNAN